jgi:hypothetical protein
MSVSLRKASEPDAPFLSRICLLTCDAGKSGELLHDHPELPGLVYAVPYVKLPYTYGFVMVVDETQDVVGYILGATDTRNFERVANEEWWPPLRIKYPADGPNKLQGKKADENYAKLLSHASVAEDACIQFSTAHLHIDILDEYQRKGSIAITRCDPYLTSQQVGAGSSSRRRSNI